MKILTMDDVPTGSVLELMNGRRYLYIGEADSESAKENYLDEKYVGLSHTGYQTFKRDFTARNSDWNISKIYAPLFIAGLSIENVNKSSSKVLWSAEREMTLAEVEKALGHKVKIVKEKESD